MHRKRHDTAAGNVSVRTAFLIVFLLAAYCILFTVPVADASDLARVSDLISSSRPAATSTTHTISFRTANAIPQGGAIALTFEGHTVPALLDFTDIDFLAGVSTTTLAQRTLGATNGVGVDGVSVTPGDPGRITLTLGSDAGSAIPGGSYIEVRIGDNATNGAIGDEWVTSPSGTGAFHIRIRTTDVAASEIDSGSTLVVMINPVTVSTELPVFEAVRSNGLPTGLLPGGTTNVWISLNTDIPATCRYATSSGIAYSAMLLSTGFTAANLGTLHYRNEAVADNTIYNFYVRCQTPSLVANTTDYLITFEVGVVPSATSTPPPPPPPPSSSGGGPSFSLGGGGGGPYLQGGDVTLEGESFPVARLVILKDGVIEKETDVSGLGKFSEKFTNLPRGTYTWGVYVKDGKGKISTTYNSTIYLVARTNNIIAPIYVSPTMAAASTTIAEGGNVVLSGWAIPLKQVLVLMNKQGKAATGDIITATTTANGNGSWSVTIPAAGLALGTYEAKARTIVSSKDQSMLSPVVYLGIGQDANPDFRIRSDLNRDGKVNLIDFSILLFNWNGTDATADINQDGKVNITDFSIMLSNWTG